MKLPYARRDLISPNVTTPVKYSPRPPAPARTQPLKNVKPILSLGGGGGGLGPRPEARAWRRDWRRRGGGRAARIGGGSARPRSIRSAEEQGAGLGRPRAERVPRRRRGRGAGTAGTRRLSPPEPRAEPALRLWAAPGGAGAGGGGDRAGPAELGARQGLSASAIPSFGAPSQASATKGVSALSPRPVSMVTCSAPIQTAVLY